jgi:DUF1365 family protein
MNGSALYIGTVAHQRHRPRPHRLQYKVFSLFLDLDQLPSLDRSLRLFGHNRPAVFSLLDRDHGMGDGTDLRQQVRAHLRDAGLQHVDGPIRLLCYPRVLGYVFNPLSVFYCYDQDECLRAVIYEVNNIHGERHSYVLPVATAQRPIRQACDKRLFVSPFLPMDCRYHFQLNPPGERLRLFIHETHQGLPILDAWFNGQRHALSDRALLKVALSMPLLTLKVFLAIHWQALRLWRKGVPLFSHAPAPKYGVSFTDE